MKFLLTILLLGLGCQAPAEEDKVWITIRNETGRRVTLWAMAGILGREVTMEAGAVESYWVDRRWAGSRFELKIR